MRTVFHTLLIGLALCFWLPALVSAQKVSYDYRSPEDFGNLRTYSFRDAPRLSEQSDKTPAADDPFIHDRTNIAIAQQLERLGLRRDDEHPDVYVSTHRSSRTETVTYNPYGYDWGWGYGLGWSWGWGWGYGPGAWYTEEETIGTLAIDLENAKGDIIWRGTAERKISSMASNSDRIERVNREVSKVFKTFPPPGTVATGGRHVPKPTDR